MLPIAVSGAAHADRGHAKDKRALTVMTQNLYLGSSLDSALAATTPQQFVGAVATIYGTALFTDFPTRAAAIAATIEQKKPDLIGLQEVSKWTANATHQGPTPVSQDFLSILQGELTKAGLDYEVASVSNNADIGPAPLVSPSLGCQVAAPVPDCVVTLQDRDVILVNAKTPELEWSNPQSGNYATQQLFAPPAGDPISFDRGWATIDGTYQGKKFHMANTHLEVENSPTVQEAQAKEFLAGPAKGHGAVIATGDFNSAADGSTTTSFADLTKSFFNDSWAVNGGDPGLSCCQNGTLTNPGSEFATRIDLILTHAAVRAESAELVGDTPFRTQTLPDLRPIWASDHAGVVAKLRLH